MRIETLNYLLQKVYEKDYESFNALYNYTHKKIKLISKELVYKYVVDKKLYTIEDFIQEIWLELLLQLTTKELQVSCFKDFNELLIEISDAVMIKLNKQGVAAK